MSNQKDQLDTEVWDEGFLARAVETGWRMGDDRFLHYQTATATIGRAVRDGEQWHVRVHDGTVLTLDIRHHDIEAILAYVNPLHGYVPSTDRDMFLSRAFAAGWKPVSPAVLDEDDAMVLEFDGLLLHVHRSDDTVHVVGEPFAFEMAEGYDVMAEQLSLPGNLSAVSSELLGDGWTLTRKRGHNLHFARNDELVVVNRMRLCWVKADRVVAVPTRMGYGELLWNLEA